MKFQIFYEVDGEEDSFIIEGDNLDSVRKEAARELALRYVDESSAWSVEL